MKLLTTITAILLSLAPSAALSEEHKIAFVVDSLGTLQAVTESSATKSVIGCDNGITSDDDFKGVKIAYIIPDLPEPICATITNLDEETTNKLNQACFELVEKIPEVGLDCEARYTSMD